MCSPLVVPRGASSVRGASTGVAATATASRGNVGAIAVDGEATAEVGITGGNSSHQHQYGPDAVRAALRGYGLPASRVFESGESPTAEDAARHLGIGVSLVVKSLAFMIAPAGKGKGKVKQDKRIEGKGAADPSIQPAPACNAPVPVLVLAGGNDRVDYASLAAACGVSRRRIRMASPVQCEEVFGYRPGTFPPVGHSGVDGLRVIADTALPTAWRLAAGASGPGAATRSDSGSDPVHGGAGGGVGGAGVPFLYAGGGTTTHMMRVTWPELAKASGAQTARVCQNSPEVRPEDLAAYTRTGDVIKEPEHGLTSTPNSDAIEPIEHGGDPNPGALAQPAPASARGSASQTGARISEGEGQKDMHQMKKQHPVKSHAGTRGAGAAQLPDGHSGASTPEDAAARRVAYVPWLSQPPDSRTAKPPTDAALAKELFVQPRFVLDGNLGRLCRWLRVVGADAAHRGDAGREWVSACGTRDGRVVITRDRRLMQSRRAGRGALYFLPQHETSD